MKKGRSERFANVIMWGIINALEGATAVAMLCYSVWMFVMVAFDFGYTAILDFLLGILSLCVAFAIIYGMGKRIVHKCGKYL